MKTLIKPMLARDVNEQKLKFPIAVLPKIDGSWAAIQNGKLFARSLKPHENEYTTELYSNEEFEGLRGELIIGENPVAQGLCRNTSSALRTVNGEPFTTLWCFDFVTHDTAHLRYIDRMEKLEDKIKKLHNRGYDYVRMIDFRIAVSLENYISIRDEYLSLGYEGVVVRDLQAKHKECRSSAVNPELWRFKPYSSAELKVTRLVEEMKNNNEAKTNALGLTERSTHAENLEGKGTLGAIVGELVTPVLDYSGGTVTEVGSEVTISTGSLTAKECKEIWDNPCSLVGKVVEFEFMSYGLKEKPRFAAFKQIRSEVDL